MAAALKTPFQIVEADRPLLRPLDDDSKTTSPSNAVTIAAAPKFVFGPNDPPANFELGAAQRSVDSNGQSADIEPDSGTQHVPRFEPIEPVIRLPPIGQQTARFQKLQEYEGEVLSIGETEFVAG